jgi:hypothetical protein
MKTIKITYDAALNTFVARNAFAIEESLRRDGWNLDPYSGNWLNNVSAKAINLRGLMDDLAKRQVDHAFEIQAKRPPLATAADDEHCYSNEIPEPPADDGASHWPPEDDDEPNFLCCDICGREIDDLEFVGGATEYCQDHRWMEDEARSEGFFLDQEHDRRINRGHDPS